MIKGEVSARDSSPNSMQLVQVNKINSQRQMKDQITGEKTSNFKVEWCWQAVS